MIAQLRNHLADADKRVPAVRLRHADVVDVGVFAPHQQTLPVARRVGRAGVRIVRGAHRIGPHLLDHRDVGGMLRRRDGPPHALAVLMVVHPAHLALDAVQVEAVIPELRPPEAKRLADGIMRTRLIDRHLHLVELRILRRPQLVARETEAPHLVRAAIHGNMRHHLTRVRVWLEPHAVRSIRHAVDANRGGHDKGYVAVQSAIHREVGLHGLHAPVNDVVHLDLKQTPLRRHPRRRLEAERGVAADMPADLMSVNAHNRLLGRALAPHEVAPAVNPSRKSPRIHAAAPGVRPRRCRVARWLPLPVTSILHVPCVRNRYRLSVKRPAIPRKADRLAHPRRGGEGKM